MRRFGLWWTLPRPRSGKCLEVERSRILAKHSVSKPVEYPDFSTKEKAQTLIKPFVDGKPPKLL